MLQGQKHCLLIFHISLYKLFRYNSCLSLLLAMPFFLEPRSPLRGESTFVQDLFNMSTEIYPFACLLTTSHFGMQIAFTVVVFPCLLLQYTGQAAYIAQNRSSVVHAFYYSLPGNVKQRDS